MKSLTIKQLATQCRYSAAHLRREAREGRLAAEKNGRDWFVTDANFRAWLAQDARRKT